MSYCTQEGKDKIIFATREDHEIPSLEVVKILVDKDDDEEPGLILPNGDINWSCPCLGGMATGPCGVDFREAFSCFHYSKADPKGTDCYDQFNKMQDCMLKYPEVYPRRDDDDNDDPETAVDIDDLNLQSLDIVTDNISDKGENKNTVNLDLPETTNKSSKEIDVPSNS